MKKVIILVGLLLAMAHVAIAKQQEVFMDFYRKSNPGKNVAVHRTPMCLPIQVFYDPDTHNIEVIGNESLEAEVFLYNANGILENYSSSLNTDFTILTPGTYIVQIQNGGWYAEGKIEI